MPFQPLGTAQTLNVTDAGQVISITAQPQCRIFNAGAQSVRVKFSSNAAAASDADVLVPAGLVEVFTRNGQNWLSAVCATGQISRLEIMPGQGD